MFPFLSQSLGFCLEKYLWITISVESSTKPFCLVSFHTKIGPYSSLSFVVCQVGGREGMFSPDDQVIEKNGKIE